MATHSIHRSPSILNLSKLFSPLQAPSRSQRQSVSFASNCSENYESEEREGLYMAGPRRSGRGSLSDIGNRRAFDRSTEESELKAQHLVQDPHEQSSYSIIDKEISEWQHVCRTGRPLWWQPESRYGCLKDLTPWPPDETNQHSWYDKIRNHPEPKYRKIRQAVSDSYLSDPNAADDLAQIVAVQLLSSCFTLPPDLLLGESLDKKAYPHLFDPRMISSLRMHTNFRYSPCFGHQPRDPSPAQSFLALYDGESRGSSPPLRSPDIQTSIIGTSASMPGSKKDPTPHNGTEGWASRKDNHPFGSRGKRIKEGSIDYFSLDRSIKSPKYQKMNYRLQPELRSEPHPVFIQPVKEMVVKRWKTFRRRFGGSLYGALTSTGSDDVLDSGPSGATSPGMSSDARTRRLRAQERGEIHSDSFDSVQHYNTPVSEQATPFEMGAAPGVVSSRIHVADPLVAAASLAIAQGIAPLEFSQQPIAPTTIAVSQPILIPRPLISTSATHANTQSEPLLMLPRPSLPPISPPYTSRIRDRKGRRRSILSEMHTPEEFANEESTSASSQAGRHTNALSSVSSTLALPTRNPDYKPQTHIRAKTRSSCEASGCLIEGPVHEKNYRRPRMLRASTNGTQVFSPSEDGVEVDGLPVGPTRYAWDGTSRRKVRSYL